MTKCNEMLMISLSRKKKCWSSLYGFFPFGKILLLSQKTEETFWRCCWGWRGFVCEMTLFLRARTVDDFFEKTTLIRFRKRKTIYLFDKMVPRGLEPRTLRLLAVRSDQLSYETRMFENVNFRFTF